MSSNLPLLMQKNSVDEIKAIIATLQSKLKEKHPMMIVDHTSHKDYFNFIISDQDFGQLTKKPCQNDIKNVKKQIKSL